MRPWIIVLLSAVGAIIATVAIAVPEVTTAPRSDIASILLAHAPVLAIAALAVFALCAILLTTASLVAGALRLCNDLISAVENGDLGARPGAAIPSNQVRQLATRLIYSGTSENGAAFQARLNGAEARREIGRLYYISLARSHFPSALIVLAGVVALGLAQDHGSLPWQLPTIPTASAALITAGLGLLYLLGRIAIDVTAEPLLETMSQLRISEPIEVGLLRRAVELLEIAGNNPATDSQRVTPSTELPQQLVVTIEQSHHLFADAISRLSANTEALEAAIRAFVEPLEAVMHVAGAGPTSGDYNTAAGAAFPELQVAVEELTGVLRRLSAVPEPASIDPTPPSGGPPAPRLARELRQLLQEIEAAR